MITKSFFMGSVSLIILANNVFVVYYSLLEAEFLDSLLKADTFLENQRDGSLSCTRGYGAVPYRIALGGYAPRRSFRHCWV